MLNGIRSCATLLVLSTPNQENDKSDKPLFLILILNIKKLSKNENRNNGRKWPSHLRMQHCKGKMQYLIDTLLNLHMHIFVGKQTEKLNNLIDYLCPWYKDYNKCKNLFRSSQIVPMKNREVHIQGNVAWRRAIPTVKILKNWFTDL